MVVKSGDDKSPWGEPSKDDYSYSDYEGFDDEDKENTTQGSVNEDENIKIEVPSLVDKSNSDDVDENEMNKKEYTFKNISALTLTTAVSAIIVPSMFFVSLGSRLLVVRGGRNLLLQSSVSAIKWSLFSAVYVQGRYVCMKYREKVDIYNGIFGLSAVLLLTTFTRPRTPFPVYRSVGYTKLLLRCAYAEYVCSVLDSYLVNQLHISSGDKTPHSTR